MARDPVRDADTATWQAGSALLAYPDDALLDRLPLIRAAVTALPEAARTPLERVVHHITTTPLGEQQRTYVATFDLRKRCCLYLSWWLHGDTRNRGAALVEFISIYRAAGVTPPARELPDHLAVVLEFAARVDPVAGGELLARHRAALELIRAALHKLGAAHAGVLDAVCSTLPSAAGDAIEAARRIAAAGPPRELVGLEGYQ